MFYDKCLKMSYKNSLTSDQNIVPNCAIVPNIDRQSNIMHDDDFYYSAVAQLSGTTKSHLNI